MSPGEQIQPISLEREKSVEKSLKNMETSAFLEEGLVQERARQLLERMAKNWSETAVFRGRSLRSIFVAGMLALGANDLAYAQERDIAPLTQEEKTFLEQSLGMDLPTIERYYAVEILVNVGVDGQYMVDIGQLHKSTADDARGMMARSSVVQYQRNLETVLQSFIRENGVKQIFLEGYADPDIDDVLLGLLQGLEQDAQKINTDAPSQEDLFAFLELQENYLGKCSGGVDDYLKFRIHAIGEKIAESLKKEGGMSRLDLSNQLDENAYALFNMNRSVRSIGDALGALTGRTSDEDTIYYSLGATFKLFADGSLQGILPTEDVGLNQRAKKAWVENDEAERGYRSRKNDILLQVTRDPRFVALNEQMKREKSEGKNTELTERQLNDTVTSLEKEYREKDLHYTEIAERYEKAKMASDDLVLEQREDMVIQRVIEYGTFSGNERMRVVVFGDNHNFLNNVVRRNEKSSQPLGLIKLTPRSEM